MTASPAPTKTIRGPRLWERAFRSANAQTFLSNVAILVMGAITSVLLARWLGPKGRGEVAAALLWPSVLIYVGNLGLVESVTYYAARDREHLDSILGNALILAALESAVIVPLGYLAMPLLLHSQSGSVIYASRVYLLMLPPGLLSLCALSVLLGMLQVTPYNLIRLINPVGYLGGTVVLYLVHRLTPLAIVDIMIGASILILTVSIVTLMRGGLRLRLSPDLAEAKRLLTYGLKAYVGGLSGQMNQRLDQLLLAALVSATQLGLYVVAVSITVLIQPLAQAIGLILLPSVARERDRREQIRSLEAAFRSYWTLALPFLVISAVVLPYAVPLVFGAGYDGAVLPAEILLIGSIFVGGKAVLGGGAQALGDPLLSSLGEVTALLVTVVLLAALLPFLGILGAAIASLAAYAMSFSVVVYGLGRRQGMSRRNLFSLDWLTLDRALHRMRSVLRTLPGE